MVEFVKSMIAILTAGLQDFATGFGQGLTALVTNIFVETGTDGAMELTVFGGLVLAFAAISLCIGLSRWIMNWVSSLGN